MKKFDLENRLIDFAADIITFCKSLDSSYASKHLSQQLIRSGTAPALHYGEAQSAESPKDFIHKMKLALKELRESWVNLKIIERSRLSNNYEMLLKLKDECNQLISIFVKSIQTAQSNRIS